MSGKKFVQIGRPILHGGYSVQTPGQLLKGPAKKRLRYYLSRFRHDLTEDLGGEERLTAAQTVLIDRALSKLAIIRLIELYIMEAGPFSEPGKLRPVLIGPYISYTRELRADLQLLGIERRVVEEVLALPWDEKEEAKEER